MLPKTPKLSILTFLLRLILAVVALFLILLLAFPIGFYGMAMYIEPSLPKTNEFKTMSFEMPLQIYTADHKLIGQYGKTYSMPISYQDLPKPLIQAFLAAEDDSFFEHSGISVKGLGRAITQIVSDSHQQTGGSTITQQVAKNYFLSSEQTFERKLTEMFLARKIENDLTKDEIMTLYVNKIYLGQGAYGIRAGARRYYNKELNELTLSEMAMLAGLPKAPSEFNPVVNPTRALERRNWILGRMKSEGYISQQDYEEAVSQDIGLNLYQRPAYDLDMPDLAELARVSLVNQYGEQVMNSGWKVVLTIDSQNQLAAEKAVSSIKNSEGSRQTNSPTLESRSGNVQNFTVATDALSGKKTYPAQITTVGETRLDVVLADGRTAKIERPLVRINKKRVRWPVKEGYIIRIIPKNNKETAWEVLYPHIQGALASINPHDGAVIALVAGINTKHTNFNRATQGYRQPGSTIKPLVYAALMEHRKLTPDSMIKGSTFRKDWPRGGVGADSSLREALARSRNTSAVHALNRLGVERGIDAMSNMGLDKSRMSPSLALALGAGEATPLQMATAYATFINGGHRVQPYLIAQIYNFDNHIIYQASPAQACAVCFNSTLDKTNEFLLAQFEQEQEQNNQTNATDKNTTDTASKSDDTQTAADDNQVFRLKPISAPQYVIAEQAPRLLSEKTANNMASMLRSAIAVTGKRALIAGRDDIGGKTGTTNQAKDVWFAGVHPDNAAVVWVGFDTPKPLLGGSAFGGTLAAPIWRQFMVAYFANQEAAEAQKAKLTPQEKDKKTSKDTPKTDSTDAPTKAQKTSEVTANEELDTAITDIDVQEGVDALPGDEALDLEEDETDASPE